MKKYCVDTNYILKFLLNDIEEQALEVENLLKEVINKQAEVFVSVIVQMEIIYVLSSFYKVEKSEVYQIMKKLYDMSFIEFEYYDLMQNVMNRYMDYNISIQDSFLIKFSKDKEMDVKTFDKKY